MQVNSESDEYVATSGRRSTEMRVQCAYILILHQIGTTAVQISSLLSAFFTGCHFLLSLLINSMREV
jgi:hypothetical protein